ncbi:GNAT family N-acetyltransferase [Flavimarina sp. Hel_I_48]|uniref:GNAT family N-acetyltransferase n=1 Tax=Flavimarina sp. Hel_I_48 TaxID=1392488 RepID=UPI0004DF175D|nr:GNAT family N-acetyltransferase [Flavimarina sp. Hel_I_48]
MIEIQSITAQDTYGIRHKVLRPGRPFKECFFEGDTAPQTFHIGAFSMGKLIGVASFMVDEYSGFSGKQFRLRGMAVLTDYQGQGIGKKLVVYGEEKVREKGFDLLWFNARKIAIEFYKRLGFTIKGNAFEIPTVGKHYVMFKKL